MTPGPERQKRTELTHQLTLCAMMAAIIVVILALGGMIGVGTYAAPMLACAVLIPVRERCRASYAWACFAAAALLGLLLGADKELDALFLFLGWYPLVQPKLQKLRPALLRWAVKLLIFLLDTTVLYALLLYVIGLESVLEDFSHGFWLNVTAAVIGCILFILGDLLLTRITDFWRKKAPKLSLFRE